MEKKCDNCNEFLPLYCGAHGDCNETGLIVPNDAYCPSWNQDDPLFVIEDYDCSKGE